MAQTSPQHLLNTSWTSHRLSPLHHGSEFETLLDNPIALNTYATRLRDHLTNSLADAQGWRVDEDAGALSSIGALQSCKWEAISTLSFLDGNQKHQGHPCGILVTLTYENITYKAALLAAPTSATEQKPKKNSTYLPLLLTRFPKSLRESVLWFLSATFDTYCSLLKFPSQFMCVALETYVGSLAPESAPSSSSSSSTGVRGVISSFEDIMKELHLTLSFAPPIAPALKTLNVSIPRDSLAPLVRVDGSAPDPGSRGDRGSSVLSGLSAYLHKHLALDAGIGSTSEFSLAGGYVRLTRVACAGFVITAEGRMKLVAQAQSGENVSTDDYDDDTMRRNRYALRASEVLLRVILQRAIAGE